MNKRLTTAFVVFSLLVFSFLIVWFVFRTINTRSHNILSAREELKNLSRSVSSTYLSTGTFTSGYFRDSLLRNVGRRDELRALIISTNQVEFAYALSNSYFTPDFDFEKTVSFQIEFSINPISEVAISHSAIIPSGDDIRLDAVFRVFGRSEVFPLVRELLVGLLSFLFVIAIIIIIQPYLANRIEKAANTPPAEQPGSPAWTVEQPSQSAESISPALGPGSSAMGLAGLSPATPGSAGPTSQGPISAGPLAAAPASPVPPSARGIDRISGPGHISEEPFDAAGPRETAEPSPASKIEKTEGGGLYSPETDLVFEQYLEERLSAELKRAASFDQDLVLLLGCVDGLKRTDAFYAKLSRMAQEFFNFQDLCFEYGDGGIGIIIPNVDIDEGIERVEGFKNRVDRLLQESGASGTLSAGLSARNGRLISGKRIIREASSALRRAERESAHIIAFRVDPEKYRDYIASRKSSIQR